MGSSKDFRRPSAEDVLEFTQAVDDVCSAARGVPYYHDDTVEVALARAYLAIDAMGDIPIDDVARHRETEGRSWPGECQGFLLRMVQQLAAVRAGGVSLSTLDLDLIDGWGRYVEKRACYFLGMEAEEAREEGRPPAGLPMPRGYWTTCVQEDVRIFHGGYEKGYSGLLEVLHKAGELDYVPVGGKFNVRWRNPETDARFREWMKLSKADRRKGGIS